MSKSRVDRIKDALVAHFQPTQLQIVDDSEAHRGHHGAPSGSEETHLKIFIVSNFFEGLSRLQRQQAVNKLIDSEFKNGLHALNLKTLTESEFISKGRQAGFESH